MKKNTLLLILVTFCLFSCNQNSKSTLEKIEQSEKKSDKNVYTKYKCTNSEGGGITIENSLPKGGMKYTDVKGEIYNYVVFWTRIMNETDNALELNINFPLNSYEVPSLTGKYYEILIPSDTMTIEKSPLYLYGLSNFETFLNNNIHKESNLKRTINSKESTGFYVVMLCLSEGAHGTMRTELNLKEENLFYRVKVDGSNTNNKSSDKQIRCGNINLKNLILQK
jgi:hypothetical protein